MKLENHVLRAIETFKNDSQNDEPLMHATFAVEATARKLFPNERAGKRIYKACIRQYLWLIERFVGDGLNLVDTRWTNLKLEDGNGKTVKDPDLADIIYHMFRCTHAHASELPRRYHLLPSGDGHNLWLIDRTGDGGVRMPNKIIWALVAVSVFSAVNSDVKTEGEHFLTWGSESLGIGTKKFLVRDYWGKEAEVKKFLSAYPQTRVKLEKL